MSRKNGDWVSVSGVVYTTAERANEARLEWQASHPDTRFRFRPAFGGYIIQRFQPRTPKQEG